jgi:hypothetical protein
MQENSKQYILNSRLGLQPNLQNYNYNCFTHQLFSKSLPLHALCGICIPTNKIFMLYNFMGLPLHTESKPISNKREISTIWTNNSYLISISIIKIKRIKMRGHMINHSSHTMALGSTKPLTEMSTRDLPGGIGQPEHKAHNLITICEPIV